MDLPGPPSWLLTQLCHEALTQCHTSSTVDLSIADGHLGALLLLGLQQQCPAATVQALLAQCLSRPQQHVVRGLYGNGSLPVTLALCWMARHGLCSTGTWKRHLDIVKRQITHHLERTHHRTTPQAGDFDLMYGLTGVGLYLLETTADQQEWEPLLKTTVESLTTTVLENPLVVATPGHMIPPEKLQGQVPCEHYFDTGLAHGLAGPLMFFSLLQRERPDLKSVVPALQTLLELLLSAVVASAGQETLVPWLPHGTSATFPAHLRKPVWCSGMVGTLNAMHHAAFTLRDPATAERCVQLMETVWVRCHQNPVSNPYWCHGQVGLLATMKVFCERARLPLPHVWHQETHKLMETKWDPTPSHTPSLLNGNLGVYNFLLSLKQPLPSELKRFFLLD